MNSGPGGIPDVMRVTDNIPDLRIVLDHLPGSKVPDEAGPRDAYLRGLQEAAKRKVYVKFSEIFQRVDAQGRRVQSGGRIPRELNFYRPWLDEIWEIFGPDRLLYASDWSNSEPMSTFGETLAMVHEYVTQKDPTANDKVFWKNSLAAYRWIKRRANQPGLA
jgi:predicted TIM-barrel fold metal-dependent hydrolase